MKRIVVKDFRPYPRDRFIDAQTSTSAKLSPTLMLANEMGVEGDLREHLTPTAWEEVGDLSLPWELHPGENELAVRSVNLFGRQGRISRARVCCEE